MTGIQIGLAGMEFFAYHGCYPEEKEKGNWFQVDIQILVKDRDSAHTDELSQTTDYAAIYQICREEMEVSRNLLETVSGLIADRVMQEFSEVLEVDIRVSKKNPPVVGVVKESWVRRIVTR